MVIYGCVLVVIVMFAPRGVVGTGLSVRSLWARHGARRD
jgi:branched-chain amino acid transport system permease protein